MEVISAVKGFVFILLLECRIKSGCKFSVMVSVVFLVKKIVAVTQSPGN